MHIVAYSPKSHEPSCTSRRAPSSVLAVRREKCSPVSSVPCQQLWFYLNIMANFSEQISCQISHFVVPKCWESPSRAKHGMIDIKFAITNTLLWYLRGICQAYLRQRASRNAPLCRLMPCSLMASTDNQVEAPFSIARSIARCCGALKAFLNSLILSSLFLSLPAQASALILRSSC